MKLIGYIWGHEGTRYTPQRVAEYVLHLTDRKVKLGNAYVIPVPESDGSMYCVFEDQENKMDRSEREVGPFGSYQIREEENENELIESKI